MAPVKPQARRPQPADVTVLPFMPSMALDATMQFTTTAKDANGEKFQFGPWIRPASIPLSPIDAGRC
jgi:hypothetical protein